MTSLPPSFYPSSHFPPIFFLLSVFSFRKATTELLHTVPPSATFIQGDPVKWLPALFGRIIVTSPNQNCNPNSALTLTLILALALALTLTLILALALTLTLTLILALALTLILFHPIASLFYSNAEVGTTLRCW